MKDVLNCTITTPGEQCVMMDSLTQQQELFVALSDSGTFRLVGVSYVENDDVFVSVFL